MTVVLLLALIWAAVLVPPAVRSHAERREAFLVSFGPAPVPDLPPPPRRPSKRVEHRRRVAGGLLFAMAATLLVGLLPTFRVLLVVHLFLVDSFLAYLALLAHLANRAARVGVARPVPVTRTSPRRRRARRAVPRTVGLPELGPMAPAG